MINKEEYKFLAQGIRAKLEGYLSDNPGIDSLVMGLSGGVDSTLIAALASPVCTDMGVQLIGRSLPVSSNKGDEIDRAKAVGSLFCDDFEEVYLQDVYEQWLDKESRSEPGLMEQFDNDAIDEQFRSIRRGNIKARLRMIYLYNLAHMTSGMVMSTDNLTEYLLGFWTLHGDVGDYGMIQFLWKTEVYNLVEYLSEKELAGPAAECLKEAIGATATDGLGVSESDLDQLLPKWREKYVTSREGYEAVDEILLHKLVEDGHPLGAGYAVGSTLGDDNIVVRRMLATQFKRDNPISITRDEILNMLNQK